MTRNEKVRHLMLGVLCVFLVLVCAFYLFLPSFHQCDGMYCSICACLVMLEEVWSTTFHLAIGACAILVVMGIERETLNCEPCSLVRLKVKLSN